MRLGGVEGTFTLPDPLPRAAAVHQRRQRRHADHEHAARPRTPRRARRRRAPALRADRRRRHLRRSAARRWPTGIAATGCTCSSPASAGGIAPARPRRALPRLARARGVPERPGRDARRAEDHWDEHGDARAPAHGALPAGHRRRRRRGRQRRPDRVHAQRRRAESDGGTPILVAGEEAGASLPFGCRMGICHTCVGRLRSGRVRDLRTGKVSGTDGEMVRTCINAPEGPSRSNSEPRSTHGNR